jgi:hypothetical protein
MSRADNGDHETFDRLLACAKEQYGVTRLGELSKLLGESMPALSNWAKRGVSKTGAQKVEEEFGWSALYILENIRPRFVSPRGIAATAIIIPPRLIRRVRVAGELQAMKDAFSLDLIAYEDETKEVAAYTGGQAAHAVRIANDRLQPRYRRGEYLIVADSATPRPGGDVLVHLADGGYLVKQLGHGIEDTIQLIDLRTFEPMTLRPHEVREMRRVLGSCDSTALLPPVTRK